MKIIFFRHGQTEFNLEDRFQGVANSPLTDKGIEQAQKMNEVLKKNFNVKKFLISPAGRVIQTFELASKDINASHEIEYRIRECCYGNWDGKLRTEIPSDELEEKKKDKFNYIHPGNFSGLKGESYAEVYGRVLPLLEDLKTRNEEGDICIISHNGIMLAVEKYFQNLSDEDMNNERVGNDEYFVYDTIVESFEEFRM